MSIPSGALQPHRGTLILVLGILGLVVCFPCGIAAWILANGDLKKMDSGLMDPEGRGNTKVGKILGIIAVALLVLGIIFSIIFFLFMGGVAAMSQGASPTY
ncbi:MAG TPA: hypothetical protein VMN36_06410 [Verrucomicrobiales bacterium]|nr:hypothetical protein [Verrucomicrobiales bacterium]